MRAPSSGPSRSMKPKKSRFPKKWNCIPILSITEAKKMSENELCGKLFDKGFCIRFFRQDMQCSYTVASHHVLITRGVLEYVHGYNQFGPNKARHKLFLCSQFSTSKTCINGSRCREVHCTLPLENAVQGTLFGVMSNATAAPNIVEICDADTLRHQHTSTVWHEECYINDVSSSAGSFTSEVDSNAPIKIPENVVLQYSLHSRWTTKKMCPTLPPGITFRLALPNTLTPVEECDSGEIFFTRGANEYYLQIKNKYKSSLTMQHCAHLMKNGMCCYGEDCAFVHVVDHSSRHIRKLSASDEVFSKEESFSCSDSGRSFTQRKRNMLKETPLSTDELPNTRCATPYVSNTRVTLHRDPEVFQENNTVQPSFFAPAIASEYGNKAMPILMMPVHPVHDLTNQMPLFSFPSGNIPSSSTMLQDAYMNPSQVPVSAIISPYYLSQEYYPKKNVNN